MFKRNRDDLFVEHTLSLTEALCGFQFPLTHLDGRQLLVKSAPGEIIEPGTETMAFSIYPVLYLDFLHASYDWWNSCFLAGEYKVINDEGMPKYERPSMKGRLYVHFSVCFPKSGTLSLDQIETIEAGLPPRASGQSLDECEETTLRDVNIDDKMRRKHSSAL